MARFYLLLIYLTSVSSFLSKLSLKNGARRSLIGLEDVHPRKAVAGGYIFEERDFDSDTLLSTTKVDDTAASFLQFEQVTKNPSLLSPKQINRLLRNVFLPSGFPHSVPPEYATFQKWNLIQDASSYLRGIMSTQAILTGMGVGRSDITALQATVQWVLRDGASMLGGLLFTSLSSANFGQNVKSWRLFADFINNLGITLDMVAPLTGKYFLPIICVASVCKALCGIAAGATNVVISEHWGAKNGNMADVQAKNGAQHTMVNLLGLAVSVSFARFASSTPLRLWSTYITLTILHMYSNYKAMRVLSLRSLNLSRYYVLVNALLDSKPMQEMLTLLTGPLKGSHNEFDTALGSVKKWMTTDESTLSLKSVAKNEPIVSLVLPFNFILNTFLKAFHHYSPRVGDSKVYERRLLMTPEELDISIDSCGDMSVLGNVRVWAPPATIAAHFSSDEIKRTMAFYDKLNYFIISRSTASSYSPPLKGKRQPPVYVCFKRGATAVDQARATMEAIVYERTRNLSLARVVSVNIFPIFWESLDKWGWDLKRVLLRPQRACVYNFADPNVKSSKMPLGSGANVVADASVLSTTGSSFDAAVVASAATPVAVAPSLGAALTATAVNFNPEDITTNIFSAASGIASRLPRPPRIFPFGGKRDKKEAIKKY